MSYKYYYNIYIYIYTIKPLPVSWVLFRARSWSGLPELAGFVREFVLLRQCMVLSCTSNRAIIFLFVVCSVAGIVKLLWCQFVNLILDLILLHDNNYEFDSEFSLLSSLSISLFSFLMLMVVHIDIHLTTVLYYYYDIVSLYECEEIVASKLQDAWLIVHAIVWAPII